MAVPFGMIRAISMVPKNFEAPEALLMPLEAMRNSKRVKRTLFIVRIVSVVLVLAVLRSF